MTTRHLIEATKAHSEQSALITKRNFEEDRHAPHRFQHH